MTKSRSRRTRFTSVRRRRSAAAPASAGSTPESAPDQLPPDAPTFEVTTEAVAPLIGMSAAPAVLWHGREGLQQIAQLLWLLCGTTIWVRVRVLNERARVWRREAAAARLRLYRARLAGSAAERYDARRRKEERDEMAISLHAANQQHWSPSMLGRSISYFRHLSAWVHSEETHQRRLASKPIIWDVLRIMRDREPEAPWPRGEHVHAFGADQTCTPSHESNLQERHERA